MNRALTEQARAMVAAATPMVAQVVRAFRVEPHVREELRSAGFEALSLAALRYDASQGPFEPFASAAVRGAVLRTLGKEFRARRPLQRLIDRGSLGLTKPRDTSLEEALSSDAGDERADVVAGLERVVAGYLGVESVRAASGEEQILSRDAYRRVLTALDTVSSAERAAFMGYMVEGRSHEELRTEAGLSKRTVQRMIERTQETIRGQFPVD